jgi:glycosyltransferase involved in cell wall biosynthesis
MHQTESIPALTRSAQSQWRLLIVVNVSWFFVMHRLPIAIMARERGVDVHIACGEGPGADDIKALGFPFHPLPMTRDALAPFKDVFALRALTKLYRELRPDIVHHVTLKPVIYGSMAARIAGVPAVMNAFAGLGYTFTADSLLARVRRSIIEKMLAGALRIPRQVVVFENNDDRLLLTGAGAVPAEQAEVISGIGVDTAQFPIAPEPAGPPCVLFASRMLREKGVEYFVEAARRLKSEGLHARFLLVGKPDPFNPGSITEYQLHEWARSGVVEWTGFRSDMARVLQESNIVCLPTFYREGVPRILLEAASSGRALVATDMPGCRDIVKDGSTGLLVQPHDVDGLVAALRSLILDADLRARLGAAGRELVERQFALPKVLDEFWRLYSQLRVAGPAANVREG